MVKLSEKLRFGGLDKVNQLQVPSKIRAWIDKKSFTVDDIGMSGNEVLIFDDMVLKITDNSAFMADEVQLMRWLEGKIPVPQVLEYEEKNGKCYLLMSRIGGEMSCDDYYLENPNILLKALACGLKMLWEVDVKDCPHVRDLDTVLKEARMQVENNLVDLDNVESDTFGENGFESPKHLLEWLENNRPTFEPVFSHGDYCLPNIFLENGKVKGFIDLGRAGIGDKWNDIALCYRSLKHNFDGSYGGKVYEDFNPDMLFEMLGIEPEWEKINYYLLLDELF
ncbi:MAG: aminoglycoside 3'-phosphotransferase [Lachnospiraceae bacterium]|nr:aminoglycoside 3'-phosphotransferase [Lachnospiraceae bacterium]